MRHLQALKRRRFMSLRWKTLWLLSLVLVGMHALLALIQYRHVQQQYLQERIATEQRVFGELRSLLWHSGERLQQTATLVPHTHLCDLGNQVQLAETDSWAMLQTNLGWDVLAFYDLQGVIHQPLANTNADLFQFDAQQQPWIKDAALQQHGRSALACAQDCGQFAAVPVLDTGGHFCGMLVVGASLAESLIDFLRIRSVSVGVLRPIVEAVAQVPVLQLTRWNRRVTLLTGLPESSLVLQQLEREMPQPPASRALVSLGDRTYVVWLAGVPVTSGTTDAQLALVEDVSADLAKIAAANWDMLWNGLVALGVSELALLLLLWPSLRRVQQILKALPLLGRNAFPLARQHFEKAQRRRGLHDEIDLLQIAALDLTVQLERLRGEVLENTEALNRQMLELVQERDFVSCLLDTAEVAILTTDAQGYITSANPFAERMLGYPETVLRGRRLREFYQGRPVPLGEVLEDAGLSRAQEEVAIRHADGSARVVVWWHSRLAVLMPLDATLLSVGLDITARKEAEARLTWLADHDALTGLYNRRRLELGLLDILRATVASDRTGALFFLDLDQFKEINDTSGHQAGDHLLKLIAAELRRMSEDDDLVVRLGGDEFAIVRPQCNETQAMLLAQQINQCLAGIGFSISGRQFRISASIGVALFPRHGMTVDDLLVSADLAMYHAKELGRGRPVLASNEIVQRGRMEQRLRWKERLQQALAGDEFMLYFQPLLHIPSGNIAHYEALLRLRDPDGSIVEPAIIIDIAERAGMIDQLTQLVIRKGLDTLAEAQHAEQSWRLSLNLSAHDLQNPQLLDWVRDALVRTRVAPERLIFEITETAAVADFVAARSMMEKIGALGCAFALDDFGVGFSSFYYLKQFDVDYLKIDGSFIQKIVTSRENQIFVQAIVQVARGLHKQIIAEFVEDAETLAWLAEMGIDYAQGYHIGRPQAGLPGATHFPPH